MDRAADNHYGTMTTADIKALPIPAAKDCVLFLWVIVLMLPHGLAVMQAWKFNDKSAVLLVQTRAWSGQLVEGRSAPNYVIQGGTSAAETGHSFS